ncbi:MAG: SRPBCC domain-containing protein [Pseudomonadota bacterium]
MNFTTATIHRTREFDYSVDAIYAHWTHPDARQRWECGPDTGMKYDAFDTREGGIEVVRIFNDGNEVGHMVQSHLKVVPNECIATAVYGEFGGETTTIMSVLVEFTSTERGCKMEAVSQVADLKGGNPQDDHEKGWDYVLGRFEDDLAEHGPINR